MKLRHRDGALRPSHLLSAEGMRCEFLFAAGLSKRLAKGGTWSLASLTGTRPERIGRPAGEAIGSHDSDYVYAPLSLHSSVLNSTTLTIIGVIGWTGTGTTTLVSQRPSGSGLIINTSSMNLIQWGHRNNIVGGITLRTGEIVVAATRTAEHEIQYWMDGRKYGSPITGTASLSSDATLCSVGSQAGDGAFATTGNTQSGRYIYGVAVLGSADTALVGRIQSPADFFKTFFIGPYAK